MVAGKTRPYSVVVVEFQSPLTHGPEMKPDQRSVSDGMMNRAAIER